MPSIGKDLKMPESRYQWIITSYALTFGCFLLLWGKVGDIYGKRLVFLLGGLWVAVTSLATAFSPTEIAFDILRALSGLGAAANVPAAIGILGVSIPPGKVKNYSFAIYSAGAPLGAVCGTFVVRRDPPLSNHLANVENKGRHIDAIRVVEMDLLPCRNRQRHRNRHRLLHHPGPGFRWDCGHRYGPEKGIAGLVWRVPDHHQPHSPHLHALAGKLEQRRVACALHPQSHPGLCHPVHALCRLGMVAGEQDATGATDAVEHLEQQRLHHEHGGHRLLLGQLQQLHGLRHVFVRTPPCPPPPRAADHDNSYQEFLGLSPIATTLRFLPTGVGGAIITGISGYLLSRVSGQHILLVGVTCTALSSVLMAAPIPPETTYWAWGFPAMVLAVMGADTVYPCLALYTTSSMPMKDQALAGGLFNTVGQVGRAIGLAMVTAVEVSVREGKGNLLGDVLPHVDKHTKKGWDSWVLLSALRTSQWVNVGFALVALAAVFLGLRKIGKVGAPK